MADDKKILLEVLLKLDQAKQQEKNFAIDIKNLRRELNEEFKRLEKEEIESRKRAAKEAIESRKAEERATKEAVKEQIRLAKELERERVRSEKEAERQAKISARETEIAAKEAARNARPDTNTWSNALSSFQQKFNTLGNIIGGTIANGIFAIGSAVTSAFKTAITNTMEFEKSLSNLRAITGLNREESKFFEEQALKTANATSISARDTVEAYKLIASAMPELLKNKQGLVDTTNAAIMLSEASGLDLPTAAKKLTDSMAQLGIPASRAAEAVDVLAAAAKASKAEIPDLSDSLLQFGATAKAIRVDIKESAALIEVLAEKGIMGAEAGTALRNILLKMSAPDALGLEAQTRLKEYGVNLELIGNRSLPVEERLKELAKISGDTGAMVKVFGLENVNAAQALLTSLPRYAELKVAVNELGVAEKQAAENTDNAAGAWERFKNKLSAATTGTGAFTGVLRGAIAGLNALLESAKAAINFTGFATEKAVAEAEKVAKLMDEGIKKKINAALVNKQLGDSEESRIRKLAEQTLFEIESDKTLTQSQIFDKRLLLQATSEWISERAKSLDISDEEIKKIEHKSRLEKQAANESKKISDDKLKQWEEELKFWEKQQQSLAKSREKNFDDEKKMSDAEWKIKKDKIDANNKELIQLSKDLNQKLFDERKQSLEDFQKNLKIVQDFEKKGIDEEYNSKESQLDREYALAIDAAHKINLDTNKITEAYEKEKLKIRVDYAKKALDFTSSLLNNFASISQGLQEIDRVRFQSDQDQKQKTLDARFKAGLISEKDYNDKSEALKNQALLQEKELKKKYADIDFEIKTAQIVVATALGIMQGYAAGPVIGTIMAVVLSALGGVQIALANEQRAAVQALNYGGIVTGNDGIDTNPAMLTKDEAVLTAPAMQSTQRMTLTGTPRQIASEMNVMYGGNRFAESATVSPISSRVRNEMQAPNINLNIKQSWQEFVKANEYFIRINELGQF